MSKKIIYELEDLRVHGKKETPDETCFRIVKLTNSIKHTIHQFLTKNEVITLMEDKDISIILKGKKR